MLEIARGKYKEIEFRLDSLPKLDTIDVFDQYDNILCSAVLMLFDEGLFEQSINTMARILKDDGVLVISLRDKIESDIIDIFNYSTPLVFRVARDHDLRVVYHERMKETNRDIYWSCYVIKRCSSKK
jgi:chemotaxis methyl-accepting protein methylase